jgi:hypothetical protein
MKVIGLDHVQLAMPAGAEAEDISIPEVTRCFTPGPLGNRIELISTDAAL